MCRVMEEKFNQGVRHGMELGIQQGIQQGMQQGIQQGMQQGIQQGMVQGMQQGKAQERLEMIRNLMHSLGFSAEKAMETLCIPKSEWDQCLPRLQN